MTTAAPARSAPERSAPTSSAAQTRPVTPEQRRIRARRRLGTSDLLVVLLWSSGAAAAALFLASGGASQVRSVAEWVTNVGIVAGLVGTDFVLVMLVLAARIPILDRTIGHDRAIAVHRSLGKPALYLLLGHGLLLLIGYGLSSGIDPIAEIGPMLALPDMPLAFIAIGLLVTVVVTSLVAVRRRFSYEAWHLIHLLSYAAVAFALPHQLSVGGVLAEGSAQRVYWIGLYALAFGGILVFRFITPVVLSLRHRMSVTAVTEIAPGVTTIDVTGRDLRRLRADGGQFFIWRFWSRSTWWHSHPISLSAMPTDSAARITVRELGGGSKRLTSVPVGTAVSIEGPYGLFTDAVRSTPRLAIVAAGIGVTPVRALLEGAEFRPGDATVLLRASSEDEQYLWDEIQQLAVAKGAECYVMVGPRATTGPAWMTERDARRGVTLASVFPRIAQSDLFVCGPSAWLDLVEADARAAGVPEPQIHSERFDW